MIEVEADAAVVDDKVEDKVEDKVDYKVVDQKVEDKVDDKVEEKVDDKTEEADQYWPKDWREKAAAHYAGDSKTAYTKELKRLKNIVDPAGLYGMYREAEGKITSGNMIHKPGKNATEEDMKAYHKSLGAPDTAEDYVKDLVLADEQVLGDDDKALALGFAGEMYKAGASQQVMNTAMDWYYANQEAIAAAQDDSDEKVKYDSEKELKEEFGPAFKRKTSNISSLFVQAPGGSDLSNGDSLYARLIGGRMADGTIIGNDPDMIRLLVHLAGDANPAAAIMEEGMATTKAVDQEIKDIEKIMRTDKRDYFKNYAGRYQELLAAREKIAAHGG